MSGDDYDFDEPPKPKGGIVLREYQEKCIAEVGKTFDSGLSRVLVDMATGTGKTTVFSALAKANHEQGGQTLVLANRDKLVNQAAKRIRNETGIRTEIEMADERASMRAPIIVGSVQTLANPDRLKTLSDHMFSLVVPDESHHSLAPTWARVLNYFHFGSASLRDEWEMPIAGAPHKFNARVCGVTATPDIGIKRSLGEWYQKVAYRYSISEAVTDGYLVPLVMESISLEIDIRGLRPSKTANGPDYTDSQLHSIMVPVIEALAKQISIKCKDRKSIAFVPSIECARLLAQALNRHGMLGIFVSGACEDVDEKTEAFERSGNGSVLCNASLYVEGADFPDVSCVIFGRATKSKVHYRQQAGRGTRVLPGVVDGLKTPEERRAAIAASRKPNLLLLDPLWLSDTMDLCSPYDLFTSKPEVKERMAAAGGEGKDLVELERQAERDFIASLEKEAKKHEGRESRLINPLNWAMSLGDAALAAYEPETSWDSLPPDPGQIEFLARNGIQAVKYRGQASLIIDRIIYRETMKLASPGQMKFLKQLGFKDEAVAKFSKGQAGAILGRKFGRR